MILLLFYRSIRPLTAAKAAAGSRLSARTKARKTLMNFRFTASSPKVFWAASGARSAVRRVSLPRNNPIYNIGSVHKKVKINHGKFRSFSYLFCANWPKLIKKASSPAPVPLHKFRPRTPQGEKYDPPREKTTPFRDPYFQPPGPPEPSPPPYSAPNGPAPPGIGKIC